MEILQALVIKDDNVQFTVSAIENVFPFLIKNLYVKYERWCEIMNITLQVRVVK